MLPCTRCHRMDSAVKRPISPPVVAPRPCQGVPRLVRINAPTFA